ncbi:MAG TPA: response regulator [Opitutaceae bacterium]|nr:response regulator [Opitutaceae bacterium]
MRRRVAPSAVSPWILLVEDDALMRRMVHAVLTAQGWVVQLASSAEQAMAMVNDTLTPPAVLLCDVMLPRSNGLDLSFQLLQRIPRLSVILITGHLAALNWLPSDTGQVKVLNKPFESRDLVQQVRQALG